MAIPPIRQATTQRAHSSVATSSCRMFSSLRKQVPLLRRLQISPVGAAPAPLGQATG
jgi:hypothetical protein